MPLSKISERMFYQERFILTSLPSLNEAITDNVGFTRKQVISTVSGSFQAYETLIALLIAQGLIHSYGKPVLLLTVSSKEEYSELLCQMLEKGLSWQDAELEPDRMQSQLLVKNPRLWDNFDREARQLLESCKPSMIFIERPDLVVPCASGWNYVLQQGADEDPWGSMARKVKSLADAGNCPIWVFGELCYAQKYRQEMDPETIPASETDWRTCAQLEAYIDYWDCVIEVGWNPASGIQLSSLKNRLGGGFTNVPLFAQP